MARTAPAPIISARVLTLCMLCSAAAGGCGNAQRVAHGGSEAPVLAPLSPKTGAAHGGVTVGDAEHSDMRAASDRMGAVVVARFAFPGSTVGRQQLLRRSPDGRWQGPDPMPGTDRRSGPAAVAAAGSGMAVGLWAQAPRQQDSTTVRGWVRRGPGQELATLAVRDSLVRGTLHPAVGIDAQGGVTAAWDAAHVDAESTFPVGPLALGVVQPGSLSMETRVIDRRAAGPPAVAVGAGGRSVVAWVGVDKHGDSLVKAVVSSKGRRGTTVQTIGNATDTVTVRAAASDDGSLILGWSSRSGLHIATAGPDAHFTPPVQVRPSEADGVLLAGGPSNRLVLGWTDRTGGAWAYLLDGASHARGPISGTSQGNLLLTSVALGPQREIAIAGRGPDGRVALIRSVGDRPYNSTRIREPTGWTSVVAGPYVFASDDRRDVVLAAAGGPASRKYLTPILASEVPKPAP
jgi:hypothetical protein